MTGTIGQRGLALYVHTVTLLGAVVRRWSDDLAAREGRRTFAGPWIPLAVIAAGAIAMQIWCNVRGYRGWTFSLRRQGWSISVSAKCV